MIEKITWEKFRETGLLWWINRQLHLFGYAIIMEIDIKPNNKEKVKDIYPARCSFRGFERELDEEGFQQLTNHLGNIIEDLKREVK